jgi:hypothetical protein
MGSSREIFPTLNRMDILSATSMSKAKFLIGILLFFPVSASIFILIITLPIKKKTNTIDEFFGAHMVKMHTSYRVEILNDGSFELSQLDGSYIKSLIDQKKISHQSRNIC